MDKGLQRIAARPDITGMTRSGSRASFMCLPSRCIALSSQAISVQTGALAYQPAQENLLSDVKEKLEIYQMCERLFCESNEIKWRSAVPSPDAILRFSKTLIERHDGGTTMTGSADSSGGSKVLAWMDLGCFWVCPRRLHRQSK
jgi:hypothetical protein